LLDECRFYGKNLKLGGDLDIGKDKAKVLLPTIELNQQTVETGKEGEKIMLERLKWNIPTSRAAAFQIEKVALPPGMAGDYLELPRRHQDEHIALIH
jgi:hypothetical protein